MLSALSYASAQKAATNYQVKAKSLAKKLIDVLLNENPPRAIGLNNEYLGQANLEDFAFVLQGLYDYQRLSKNNDFTAQINQLEHLIKQRFYRNNEWQYEANPLIKNIENMDFSKDGALPSSLAIVRCLQATDTQILSAENMLKNPIEYVSYFVPQQSLKCKAL